MCSHYMRNQHHWRTFLAQQGKKDTRIHTHTPIVLAPANYLPQKYSQHQHSDPRGNSESNVTANPSDQNVRNFRTRVLC